MTFVADLRSFLDVFSLSVSLSFGGLIVVCIEFVSSSSDFSSFLLLYRSRIENKRLFLNNVDIGEKCNRTKHFIKS